MGHLYHGPVRHNQMARSLPVASASLPTLSGAHPRRGPLEEVAGNVVRKLGENTYKNHNKWMI